MEYVILGFILIGLAVIFFITKEKIQITYSSSNIYKRNSQEKIQCRQKLLLKYLEKAPKVTLKIYQTLTNVSLEQAMKDLNSLVQEGVLQEVGEEGETVYYNFRSHYHQNEIKQIINRK